LKKALIYLNCGCYLSENENIDHFKDEDIHKML
jgi:hypothetical protein